MIDKGTIDPTAFLDSARNAVMRSAVEMKTFRAGLDAEYQARIDEFIVAQNREVMKVIQRDIDFDRRLTTRLPDPKPPSAALRRFKDHDKTAKRSMTGAEAEEKQRREEEAAQKKAAKQEETARKKANKKRKQAESVTAAAEKQAEKHKEEAEKAEKAVAAQAKAEATAKRKAEAAVEEVAMETPVTRKTAKNGNCSQY
jgi:membrane protein involved in colicin uptake